MQQSTPCNVNQPLIWHLDDKLPLYSYTPMSDTLNTQELGSVLSQTGLAQALGPLAKFKILPEGCFSTRYIVSRALESLYAFNSNVG